MIKATASTVKDDLWRTFHPVVRDWFLSRFDGPTDPQQQGWPHIAAGAHTLIAAPTGSGKTLTAFLAIIDRLFRQALAGETPDGLQVVYISPLRALSNDMQKNLQQPLAEIQEMAARYGLQVPAIRTGLRTGDSTAAERAKLTRNPPQILVTTPESLYLMLTSDRARETLRSVDTVIIDEIHALVRDKRGSHLSLSLERLEALTSRRVQRIGLSATQKPISRMAEFLIGDRHEPDGQKSRCQIVDVGHQRQLDLGIVTPRGDLQAVCSNEQWADVHEQLIELINQHRSTLIFVNTRRMAERLTHQLTQILGDDVVGAHHGSLSKEIRLRTEQQLKTGAMKAVVATSSLELGIDVGYIDLVVQIGSPRAIAAFLQRIGRSGHALGLIPKGRLVALTRDELIECMALLRAVRCGRLDVTPIPEAPLDILAQQIVAETAAQEWSRAGLLECFRRAWPYRNLSVEEYERTLKMLGHGLTDTGGRAQALIHDDQINGRLKGRRAARLISLSNGGAIGETDTVRVLLEEEQTVVGTVDEEFAVESAAGDIFLLGNSSWRIQGLRGTDLIVHDAQGAPPTIPFWQGEAPGRTLELSEEVSRLREDCEARLIAAEQQADSAASGCAKGERAEPADSVDERPAKWRPLADWLQSETLCTEASAWQAVWYFAAQKAAIGLLPTQKRIVFERFFDESGGMQLVVHAPFGARINRGWGFAFRKRFCRSFDFELQATADDDGFILSLGPQHSFPLESLFPMMRTDNARNLLEQSLLIAPMFHLRWRWNVTRSLFVARMKNGKKVPPALQRFRSEDALTAVFPKLTGCQENIVGDHEIPDHPLVQQTMRDCLFEALDIEGLEGLLSEVERGDVTFIPRDTREPSPFAYELLNSNPYAFLDGGEVQERRARAVATRRSLNVDSLQDLGRLDPQAIDDVVAEASSSARDADEWHDQLLSRLLIPESAAPPTGMASDDFDYASELAADGRAQRVQYAAGKHGWCATERWSAVAAIYPEAAAAWTAPDFPQSEWSAVDALTTLLRGWLEVSGPITAAALSEQLALPVSRVDAALEAIEGEGLVLRGRFHDRARSTSDDPETLEWCHRRLLSRIHRRTMQGLRKEIEAVSPAVFQEFLLHHQGLMPGARRENADGVFEAIAQLQGWDLAAGGWEKRLLPQRVQNYRPEWLDELCFSGEVGWGRLDPTRKRVVNGRPMASMTRAIPVSLYLRDDLPWLTAQRHTASPPEISDSAREVLELLQRSGALFPKEILQQLRVLPTQLYDLLGELVASGWITADGFSGLRGLIRGEAEESMNSVDRRFRRTRRSVRQTGRWTLLPHPELPPREQLIEQWAWQLLRRWGVVFRDLVLREPLAPPWWELQRMYRRLEARGEIRGGRFVRSVSGEQFATSESVRLLRSLRQEAASEKSLVIVSAIDPVNLTGMPGFPPRVAAIGGHLLGYLGGTVVGWKKADQVWLAEGLSAGRRERLLIEFGRSPRRRPRGALGTAAYPLPPVDIAHGQSKTSAPAASTAESETSVPAPLETPPVNGAEQKQRSHRSRRDRSRDSRRIPRPYPF